VTEQERIAAALAYQQAQQPAMMNPNLARQGARGRENMMPPTSVMDERYPAFKRNQEDVEKLMLGLDIVGSAIPLAGPAAKGAVALGKYAAPQIAQGLENYAFRTGMALPMDVWHGTPHRFPPTAKNPLGEFDPTKIGTGEGAQVYGYGHYFAETPDVAKTYQPRDLKNEQQLLKMYQAAESRRDYAAMEVLENAMMHKTPNELRQMHGKEAEKIIGQIEKLPRTVGSMYKVDLPDEVVPQMLNYDKPIKEQPEILKAFRARLPEDMLKAFDTNVESGISGANAMQNWLWNSGKTDASRSETLRQMGIPGIQYLDAGSRGAGTGTRNFVVFPGNEGLLNILGRE